MQITIDKSPKTIEKTPQEWVPYKDGLKVLIAGEARPSYQYAYQLAVAEENAIRTQECITDEYVASLDSKYAGIIGRYLILGWSGIDFEYSPEQAEILCEFGKTKDDKHFGSKLALWVQKQSKEIQKRANKLKIESVGKPSSDTNGLSNSKDSLKRKSKDAKPADGKWKHPNTQ